MKASDMKPGDIVNIYGQQFTVKSVHTSGGSTTIFFEDVLATKERRDALNKFSRDTGYIAAMLPVQPTRTSRHCNQLGRDLAPFTEAPEKGEKT